MRCTRAILWPAPAIALLLQCLTSSASLVGPCDPVRENCDEGALTQRFAADDNTIIFAGLFPVHKYDKKNNRCGKIQDKGFQRMEAMRYAVDAINSDPSLLPTLALAYYLYDTCSDADTALRRVLPVVSKGASAGACASEGGAGSNSASKRAVATIGAASSTVSRAVADLLGLFSVPVVSYASTSQRLSQARYKYFLRTVPPDTYQARVMVDIAVHFGWKLVNIIHSDDDYGTDGAAAFVSQAEIQGICVGVQSKIDRHGTPNDISYTNALRSLLTDTAERPANKSQVIILFSANAAVRQLFETAKGIPEVHKRFVWIASDSTGQNLDLSNTDLNSIGSLLSIIPTKVYLKEVADHFGRINISNGANNPWLGNYWYSRFKCHLNFSNTRDASCSQHRLNGTGYKQNDKVLFVANAVFAVAHALHNILCSQTSCKKPERVAGLGNRLLEELKQGNKSFRGVGNILVSFDSAGDPVAASYEVKNLQGLKSSLTFATIATWSRGIGANHGLQVINRSIHWPNRALNPPKSVCSDNCPPGHYARRDEKNLLVACCWLCEACTAHTYTTSQSVPCQSCSATQTVSTNHTQCTNLKASTAHSTMAVTITAIVLLFATTFLIFSTLIIWNFRANEIEQLEKAWVEEVQLSLLHKPMAFQFFILALLGTFSLLWVKLVVPVNLSWCRVLNGVFVNSTLLPFIPIVLGLFYVSRTMGKHKEMLEREYEDIIWPDIGKEMLPSGSTKALVIENTESKKLSGSETKNIQDITAVHGRLSNKVTATNKFVSDQKESSDAQFNDTEVAQKQADLMSAYYSKFVEKRRGQYRSSSQSLLIPNKYSPSSLSLPNTPFNRRQSAELSTEYKQKFGVQRGSLANQRLSYRSERLSLFAGRIMSLIDRHLISGTVSAIATVFAATIYSAVAYFQSEAKEFIKPHNRVVGYCSTSFFSKMVEFLSILVFLVVAVAAHKIIAGYLDDLAWHAEQFAKPEDEDKPVKSWKKGDPPAGQKLAAGSVFVASINVLVFLVLLFILQDSDIETAELTHTILPVVAIVILMTTNFQALRKSLHHFARTALLSMPLDEEYGPQELPLELDPLEKKEEGLAGFTFKLTTPDKGEV